MMRRTFAFGLASAQGAWPVQEDGYYADPMRGVFAVSDGFGGRGAGDLASKIALQEFRSGVQAPTGSHFPPELRRQREVFQKAHKLIQARNGAKPPAGRGGCSFLAAEITGEGRLYLSHCGACQALLAKAGRLHPVLLPQAEQRREFQPLLPDQALGVVSEIFPESRALRLEGGDVLVLASSGLDWESEAFQLELISQLALRQRGEDLTAAARQVVENSSLSAQSWNRTILLIEKA